MTRAVYIAIFIGFLRRLLRKTQVPAGRRPVDPFSPGGKTYSMYMVDIDLHEVYFKYGWEVAVPADAESVRRFIEIRKWLEQKYTDAETGMPFCILLLSSSVSDTRWTSYPRYMDYRSVLEHAWADLTTVIPGEWLRYPNDR